VARCTVARLMHRLGLQGVVRGTVVKTTYSDKALPWPADQTPTPKRVAMTACYTTRWDTIRKTARPFWA
jgi:transposase InsO family protein